MKWYQTEQPIIDYNQAILAIRERDNSQYLLVQMPNSTYEWLNLTNGSWNSSAAWKKPEDAVRSYERNYKIINTMFNYART